ncbi:exocyst complex component EXO70C2-like [Alnus glutinosa]|uniref:exocyst complex component EXO70C2-like n=1 Tax=Alnus glutinosa TaxID=3517 RepID=UPI002D78B33A|nr:exocyst complex component EXO70C2-like [Alnus glutinosa]
METNLPEKSNNFGHKEGTDAKPASDTESLGEKINEEDEAKGKKIEEEHTHSEAVSDPHCDLHEVFEAVDEFLSTLSDKKDDDKENDTVSVDIPHELLEKFLDLVEAKVSKPEVESSFLVVVHRVSKLTKCLRELKPDESRRSLLINRMEGIHERAISFLEEEFQLLLEDSRIIDDSNVKGKQDQQVQVDLFESTGHHETDFPGYPDEVVASLNKVAKEMISGGYESECCQVYAVARSNAFEESLQKLGFENHSIDDVHKMQWEALEREIATWIEAFKQCTTVSFSGEKALADLVFSDHPSLASGLFSNITRGVLIQLLNFAEAVAMTKQRSAEKLFKFLDMYETLRDAVPAMEGLFENEWENELKTETTTARYRLGEAAILMFADLENSIKADTGKTPVPGGAVHPLTRYTMNYLKYACEYKGTLEQVFREQYRFERADSMSRPSHDITQSFDDQNESESHTPFSLQLMRVMELLDSSLETKAKLYKDVGLSNIFMMNNGRYILQKTKGPTEIHDLMGDTWSRKRSSNLRQYHKNYQRETWSKLLGCLSHEGLNVNGKVVRPVLKERFKSFNQMFDEIHKTQSTWVVSDEQLQSELRVSISAVVIPAYRSFLGRFSQYLHDGRQTEKYVKYQPEDIETSIDNLFDGNPTPRRRP